MIKHLIQKRIISLLLCVIVWGCESPYHQRPVLKSVKPLWSAKIIGDQAAYIYNRGLITAPIYNNSIIFSTTLISNTETEDNRLCGININTGVVNWMFPSDKSQPYGYYFNCEGYIYGKYLIARSDQYSYTHEKILCIDLENNSLVWEKEYTGAQTGSCAAIIGKDHNAYYAVNENGKSTLYQIEISSSLIVPLYSIEERNCCIVGDIMMDGSTMSFFISISENDESKEYLVLIDLESKQVILQREVQLFRGYSIHSSHLIDEKIYYTSGHFLICIDAKTAEVVWKFQNRDGYLANIMKVFDDLVVLYGPHAYIGLDRLTGRELYCNAKIGINWVIRDGEYLYMHTYAGTVIVVDCSSGRVLYELSCPAEVGYKGRFSIQPGRVHNNRLYLMSYSSVYCYPTYPWW